MTGEERDSSRGRGELIRLAAGAMSDLVVTFRFEVLHVVYALGNQNACQTHKRRPPPASGRQTVA